MFNGLKIVLLMIYINYYDYDEFQDIRSLGFGAYGRVYRATWESSDTVVALKSFEFNNCVMKEIVNEVSYINYILLIVNYFSKNIFFILFQITLLNKVNLHKIIIQFFGITKWKSK